MIRIERTLSSTCDHTVAWDYLSAFENTAEWDPGTPKAAKVGSGPTGVGTRYDLVARFRGKDSDITYVVKRFDPPARDDSADDKGVVQLAGDNKTVGALDTITVSRAGAGCQVHYVAEFRLKGLLKVAEPFVKGAFQTLGDEAMAGMQKALDARA